MVIIRERDVEKGRVISRVTEIIAPRLYFKLRLERDLERQEPLLGLRNVVVLCL